MSNQILTKEQIEENKQLRLKLSADLLRDAIEKIQIEYGVNVVATPFINNGMIVADIQLIVN